MIKIAISLLTAYLIGSIPTAYIFARFLKGVDIREHGSGNVGATNVYRIFGKIPGFAVLFIDILKGFLPVFILPVMLNANNSVIGPGLYKMLIGTSVISGHVWTVFLKFKGGKGVAATSGVLMAIVPDMFLICLGVWILVLILFRYVSLSSIIASFSLPIASIALGKPISITVFSLTICIIGTYKHKQNIYRLLRGEEKKIF